MYKNKKCRKVSFSKIASRVKFKIKAMGNKNKLKIERNSVSEE
jgi:hypothetical protein